MLLFFLMMTLADTSGLNRLQADLQAMVADQPMRFALAFHDLTSGEEVLISADVEMHAASTIKVAIMLRLFQLVEQGKLGLEQPVPIRNTFSSIIDSSPYSLEVTPEEEPVLHGMIGQALPLRSLIETMMIHSSNLATNLLLELADPVATTAAMRALGAGKIQVLRGVQDLRAFEAGRNNTCSAADMLLLMRAVAEGPAFTPASHEAMLGILRRCTHQEMIAAGIPAEAQALVANKTGRISSVEHDAAIVQCTDGSHYVLVIYCDRIDGEETRAKVLEIGRKLSRRVYDHATGH